MGGHRAPRTLIMAPPLPPPPKVTIGLPVRNGERFLEATLDSLLAQTLQDFELLISDNASTDRTPEMCRAYAARDGRVRYVRAEENRGAAWNYRRVFSLARGEYFKWCADDDPCAPRLLEACVGALERAPEAVLAFPHSIHIDADGRPMASAEHGHCVERHDFAVDAPAPHLRFRDLILHGHDCREVFAVMRTKALRTTRLLLDLEAHDIVLVSELALRGPFIQVPERLQYRRRHPDESERCFRHRRHVRLSWITGRAHRLSFPEWRLFRELVAAVAAAPVAAAERLRCAVELLRWLRWGHGRLLARDLGIAARALLRGAPAFTV